MIRKSPRNRKIRQTRDLKEAIYMKRMTAYIGTILPAVVGIVLLFVLESKLPGVLLVLLAVAIGFTVFRQLKHPDKKEDAFDKAALYRDRFHRARHSDENNNH